MGVKQRIQKLERGSPAQFREIIQLIQQGAYYDELTAEQQRRYKEYRESLGGVAEDISLAELRMMLDEDPTGFHFQLQPRKPALTEAEFRERLAEVQEFFDKLMEEDPLP